MENIFQKTSSCWAKYSEYEWVEKDGVTYLKPTAGAKASVYDPIEDAEDLVVDAVNVGLLHMHHAGKEEVDAALMGFAVKYGLLGIMSALPTTPDFLVYDTAYLPHNHFVREESMPSDDLAALFFPLGGLDYRRTDEGLAWDVEGERDLMALMMTFSKEPGAMQMSFSRDYAERRDWLLTQFKDLAFTFVTSVLYYEDVDGHDDVQRDVFRRGMAAFGGIAPTYRIALLDRPTIVWDFHSLMLGLQMMFSFMLTDEKNPLRICRHCLKAFAAAHPNAAFCSPQCKNRHNVYKSRAKSKAGAAEPDRP